jgi:hypothetical protein
VGRLDRRKHDFDVLEHVLGGVHTSSDDMPHLAPDYPEAAFHDWHDTEVLIVLREDREPPPDED